MIIRRVILLVFGRDIDNIGRRSKHSEGALPHDHAVAFWTEDRVVILVLRRIDKLEIAGRYEFSFVQQHAAIRRMMRRVGTPGRDYLLLSECAAIGTTFGEARFHAALDHAIRRSTLEADRVWLDGLNWCKNFNASRIRSRLYGAPSLMPPPTFADQHYVKVLAKMSAIADRLASR